jgi:hypothetical protein
MPGFTSPWSRSPPESSRPAGRPTLSDRRRLPRGFPPLRRHPPGQPHIQRHVHRPLRFRSHVFTTSQRFPGKPGLRGLVSCRSRPWGSPFRALLLAGVACASRRRFASLQFSTGHLSQGSSLAFSLRVSPTPAPHDAVAWFPTGARTPFPPRVRVRPHRLPRRPDPARPPGRDDDRLRLLRSLDPPAKPYRRRRRSDVPRPLLSWASPLQSLSPIEPRGLMTRRTVPSTAR